MSLRAAFALVMLASGFAHADPDRVLVVDADAELVHAIETSLAPWKLVVIAQTDGVDPSLVGAHAIQADAQFIVWRDGSELVVYDRQRDVTERRPAKAGAMDPVAAAGAALTVKTMMRLPDPDEEHAAPTGATTVTTVAPAVADDIDRVRLEAGIGIDTEAAMRVTFGVLYRPTDHALRVGGAFDVARQDVDQAGFKGSAQDYSLVAMASWTVPVGPFELEPWIAAGAMIDIVDGKHGQELRRETAVVPIGRAGLALWWWHPRHWGFAVTANANFALGTPTYTRDPTMPGKAIIYDMPGVAGAIALVAAWRR